MLNPTFMSWLLQAINPSLVDALPVSSTLPLLCAHPLSIHLTDSDLTLRVTCSTRAHHATHASLHIEYQSSTHDNTQDVQIAATSSLLVQLALAADKQTFIATHPGIALQGDTATLHAWQQALPHISPHWEEQLNARLGPLVSSVVIAGIHSCLRRAQQFQHTLPVTLSHYLTNQGMTPTKEQINHHTQALQQLRYQTEALIRRVGKLGTNAPSNS